MLRYKKSSVRVDAPPIVGTFYFPVKRDKTHTNIKSKHEYTNSNPS